MVEIYWVNYFAQLSIPQLYISRESRQWVSLVLLTGRSTVLRFTFVKHYINLKLYSYPIHAYVHTQKKNNRACLHTHTHTHTHTLTYTHSHMITDHLSLCPEEKWQQVRAITSTMCAQYINKCTHSISFQFSVHHMSTTHTHTHTHTHKEKGTELD